MNATCSFCNQEMNDGVACTFKQFDNEPPRIPYGSDEEMGMWGFDREVTNNCHDCATPPGGLHHPGCDMEVCPICGNQAIGCSCNDDEEEETHE